MKPAKGPKLLVNNIQGNAIMPLIRIIWIVLIFAVFIVSGCAPTMVQTMPTILNDPRMPGSAYTISVPPRKTVEIVLPAMCLNYSKKIPDTSERFASRPVEGPPKVRRLLALHEHMVLQQETYRRDMQHIPSLKFLSIEEHNVVTPSGGNEKVKLSLKKALDEALQYAIWHDDPVFAGEWEKGKKDLSEKILKAKQELEDWKTVVEVDGLLDDKRQRIIDQLKRSGDWEKVKADAFKKAELILAYAELELEWRSSIETLARIMRQAAGNKNTSIESVESKP